MAAKKYVFRTMTEAERRRDTRVIRPGDYGARTDTCDLGFVYVRSSPTPGTRGDYHLIGDRRDCGPPVIWWLW